jgi:hypothetical protein
LVIKKAISKAIFQVERVDWIDYHGGDSIRNLEDLEMIKLKLVLEEF